MNLWMLLGLATLVLFAFTVASHMVLRADERQRRLRKRRDAITSPYVPRNALAQASARLSVSKPTTSTRNRLKRLIGMDPQRREPYPVNPVFVAPAAMSIGFVVRWLLHGLIGPLSWIILPVATLLTMRSVYQSLDAKRSAALYKQFPDALATVVRAVRVGIPVSEAIRVVAQDAETPTSVEFGRLYDQIGIGAPLEDALREMAARNRLPEYRFFATALALQSQTGGGLTGTLENLADVVRKRVTLKARGHALAAEARTSAAILAALPFFAGGALAVMSPAYIAPLFKEGPGQTLFGGGVVWLSLGIVVMRGIIRKSLA